MTMLEAHSIAFRYQPHGSWVLRDIDLHLKPGEIVGLSGPSGRGKTTLAKILAGLLNATQGQVSLDGRPLPQRGHCPVQLILQNPELAVNPRWHISQILQEGYDTAPQPQLLQSLSIETGWLSRWPNELSGGELQRIAVARALGPHTRYIIADEITTMLDAITQAQIWQSLLEQARLRNLGVLVISHDAPLLARMCHRLVTMPE